MYLRENRGVKWESFKELLSKGCAAHPSTASKACTSTPVPPVPPQFSMSYVHIGDLAKAGRFPFVANWPRQRRRLVIIPSPFRKTARARRTFAYFRISPDC